MKKFFYGMIALLSVSLLFLGCSSDSEEEITGPTAAETLAGASDLAEKVTVEGNVVTLKENVSIAEALEIPAGVTLKVPGDKELAVNATLTIKGNGTLVGEVGAKVVVTGTTIVYGTVTVPAGTYVWAADAGGGTAGWLQDVTSSYTVAQQGDPANQSSDEENTDQVAVDTAFKNPVTNTVILKLKGTFGAEYIYTANEGETPDVAGSKWYSENWGSGVEEGSLITPRTGVYGAVEIGGLFPAAKENIAIHIKPYAGLLFDEGWVNITTVGQERTLTTDAPLTGPSIEEPQNYLSATENLNERWKLYKTAFNSAGAKFDVLLYSEATTNTVLDIDEYAVATVESVDTVGNKLSDYLNVIIDCSEVNFTVADEPPAGGNE